MSNSNTSHRVLDAYRAVDAHEETFGDSPDLALIHPGSAHTFPSTLASALENRARVTILTATADEAVSGYIYEKREERNAYGEVTGLTLVVAADEIADEDAEPTTITDDEIEAVLASI